MPRTEITVTALDREGVAQPTVQTSDSANGMFIATNTGRIILEITNTNAGTQTIGIPFGSSATIDGVAPADRVISLATGETKLIGPFPVNYYNQDDRSVYVNPSVDDDLEIRAYSIS
jgi:hypothetical protein